ncbi:hypothetical protein NZK35_09285 [Stieleria sp. ICT_E10.1]|uniref:hypothetical protein n=1 Tax=Stieleria sedimenti TaxID=2976331 RepID=UPI00217FF8BB|nr:hypothetical protein [Stieleria sedimenti]MCS7466835.1 hypothetical protein [Stieleria sedimenti]
MVDIPPTLHIHRYFYDGDREYQGPIVLGGPTTVIANHPTTGERMYVDVTLPAGSPIIAYSSKCITYVYADRRVSIRFGNWNTNRVRVHYYSGHGIGRRTRDWVQTLATKSKSTIKNSATVQSVADAAQESQSALSGVKHAVDSTAGLVVDSAASLLKMVPGVAPLSSMGDEASQAGYESSLRAAARQKEGSSLDFIRTNR